MSAIGSATGIVCPTPTCATSLPGSSAPVFFQELPASSQPYHPCYRKVMSHEKLMTIVHCPWVLHTVTVGTMGSGVCYLRALSNVIQMQIYVYIYSERSSTTRKYLYFRNRRLKNNSNTYVWNKRLSFCSRLNRPPG